jgi:hypothetical protein
MVLKGTMRGRQALKRWCLAEERHGESPEARIAASLIRIDALLTWVFSGHSRSMPSSPRLRGVKLIALQKLEVHFPRQEHQRLLTIPPHKEHIVVR